MLVKSPAAVPPGESTPMPVRATIVWGGKREADKGTPGDVLVTLSNGKSETWTTSGGCVLPHVSRNGSVGWAHGVTVHPTQGMIPNELVIARNKRIISRIEPEGPFIDLWDFVDDGICVVIRSRGAHGPSRLQKFRIPSGKLVGESSGAATGLQLPEWAKPFAEGQ